MHIDVRLSRKQPYIADHDIIECQFVNRHLIRATGFHLGQVYSPSAIGIGGGGIFFLIEFYGYCLAGIGFTPNGHNFATLHHHARLKKLRHRDFCIRS